MAAGRDDRTRGIHARPGTWPSLAVVFIVLTLAFAPSAGAAEPLRVLTSFLPMEIFTRNVVGDTPGVIVVSMLPASMGCPHDYALTPGDMRKIASADLFVANGFGMEDFLGEPVRRANPKIRIVETARTVLPIHGGHVHGDVNPHTWVSPRNAILQVREIEKALSAAKPLGAASFRRNADAYVSRLSALAAEFVQLMEAANFEKPVLVGHDIRMHELLIFFSTLGGLFVFGAMGFILGPVLAALFVTVWGLFGAEFRSELAEPDGRGPKRSA